MVNLVSFRRRRFRDGRKVQKSSRQYAIGIFRSNKQCYVSASDLKTSQVIFSVSTLSKEAPEAVKNKNNLEASKWLGSAIAAKLKEHNIHQIVFNKSGYLFHGRVKQIADSIRENGIEC